MRLHERHERKEEVMFDIEDVTKEGNVAFAPSLLNPADTKIGIEQTMRKPKKQTGLPPELFWERNRLLNGILFPLWKS